MVYIFTCTQVFSKLNLNGEELIFRNLSSSTISNLSIHPISAVFNANLEYNLVSTKRSIYFAPYKADYISGCNFYDTNYYPHTSISFGYGDAGLELDPDGGVTSDVVGIFSYGTYKIELSYGGIDSRRR